MKYFYRVGLLIPMILLCLLLSVVYIFNMPNYYNDYLRGIGDYYLYKCGCTNYHVTNYD